MKAYFCDRCGRAYPYINVTTVRAIRNDGKVRRLGGDLRLERVELCPNCILNLDDWINSKEEANGIHED